MPAVVPVAPPVPRPQPPPVVRPSPTPNNFPRPNPVLVPIAIGELDRRLRDRKTCNMGGRDEVTKKYPKTGNSTKKKRQRPCKGTGKPEVSYEKKRKRVGWLTVRQEGGGQNRLVVDRKEWSEWKEERYGNEEGEGEKKVFLEVVPRDPSDMTSEEREDYNEDQRENSDFWDIFDFDGDDPFSDGLPPLGMGKKCIYEVFEVTRRRKCRCPDGSPCRSTVKDD